MSREAVGTPTNLSTARRLVQSIRTQIPDIVSDPAQDGGAFTVSQLIEWINDAGRLIAGTAPVIIDWDAVQSQQGMDVYELSSLVVSVNQCWYDLLQLARTAELDDLFTTKITGRSWWQGPHSIHAIPRLHVWPACDRAGQVTTLVTGISATATAFTLTSASVFEAMGFVRIEDELILYRNVNTTTGVFGNILRGQGGTKAVSHLAGAPAVEQNIMFKCSRLPQPLESVDDIFELPQMLWPLVELYVLSKVRETEQDHQTAMTFLTKFQESVNDLANKAELRGSNRQGLQVRISPPGPRLYGGRVYIP
jgi:hypothetical protein